LRAIGTGSESDLRILVVQKEYLIALDVKEALAGLLPGEIETASLVDLGTHLRTQSWDLVLLDTGDTPDADRRNASAVLASGSALVFLTGHVDFAEGVPGFQEWPVLVKPFIEGQLLDAVLRGLALAGKS
jgi:hypothetical protein